MSDLRKPEDLLSALENEFARYEKALVAYSGGVDSTLVASLAHRFYGQNMMAVSATSPFVSTQAEHDAHMTATVLGFPFMTVSHPGFSSDDPELFRNPKDRCYLCKKSLFHYFDNLKNELGFDVVMHGENADDASSWRPGAQATAELKAVAPLALANMSKLEIRALARFLGLPNWQKPSDSCLATRFDYGTHLTTEALARTEEAEKCLHETLDVPGSLRVRSEGSHARIELEEGMLDASHCDAALLCDLVRSKGFDSAALDPQGYRSGSYDRQGDLKQ